MRPHSQWRRSVVLAAFALVLVATGAVRAAERVGAATGIEGHAEVLHAGTSEWTPLAAGDPVSVGDRLRTAADAKLRITLREDSELTLGPGSQLEVTEQLMGEATVSRFQLLMGVVRAIVTERYSALRSRFEVATPTAIAGVRGTSFLADYDPREEETLVVGLVDVTRVRAATDPDGAGEVELGPGSATRVRRGSRPLPPAPLPEGRLQMLRGVTQLGAVSGAATRGKANALDARRPQRAGERALSPEEKAVNQPLFNPRGGKPPPPPPPVP